LQFVSAKGPHLYLLAALTFWTLLIASLTAFHYHGHQQLLVNTAIDIARDTFNKEAAYRCWTADFGGIYVQIPENGTVPPAIAVLDDQELITTSGVRLAFIDPVTMTKMVHDFAGREFGYRGHIASLNPLNRKNHPDAWEKQALQAFKQGKAEVIEVLSIEGKPHVRLMRPLVTDERCLTCHAGQGYKAGDICGGVSVAVSMTPMVADLLAHSKKVLGTLSFIWLLGLVSFFFMFLQFQRYLQTQQKTREALQRREATLMSIFRTAPTGIGVVIKRIFQEVNEQFCTLVGYSRDELIGKDARMVYFTQEEYEQVGRKQELQFKNLGTISLEARLRHKDGHSINTLLSMTPQNLDDISAGITFTFMDMTEIKEAEKKLVAGERRYRAMMEAMHDPLFICSEDYRIEYVNPAMVALLGYDATGELCYAAIHGFKKHCPWCKGKQTSSGKHFESEIVSPKDNHSYHISHSPIVNDDGSVSDMIIFRDTTEVKRLEQQLLQSQKMEAIGQLAGGVAHDFNNILTAISGYAQLALGQIKEDSKLWSYINGIEKTGERAARLTRQLLAFSRKETILPETVHSQTLIPGLEKMLRRLISEDIHLDVTLDNEAAPIYADPGQLEQVIINLVLNAKDAINNSQSTHKTIALASSQVCLDEDYVADHPGSVPGWHLQIEVSDTGCGMDNETISHIFEPFFTTKERGKGTGLGLSTVYGIVKQNNGSVYVDSNPGHGSRFTINWPIMAGEEPPPQQAEKPTAAGGSEVILLVEDEDQIREIISLQLQQAGYTVITAANGQEALEKAASHEQSIDLLFTDLIMPGINGEELSNRMLAINPEIRTIFTSGYTEMASFKEIEFLNKENFINKPYTITEVKNRIRHLLDGSKPSAG
ncbi:MAG: PAS domain S-box protein, partial [Deltaproteobacteria bacterium]|nr:PAS domain S-box protein [Candidatus Anaeroferrophillus wilburensis]MBN2888582.1 PAS domain S-box protein [Deltaproteobacteria bacterium]